MIGNQLDIHPSHDELAAFALGHLDDGDAAAIAEHLGRCETCQQAVLSVPDDSVLALLRPDGSTPLPKPALNTRAFIHEEAVPPLPAIRQPVPTEAAPATTQASRFTVLQPHAEGGLGRVHLARDEQLRRTVALKEIRPERADDPRLRQRFLVEAEITGQLEHPGVVPIYALEHDAAGRPLYAMRFIQGRTLDDSIRAYHKQPTTLALRELLQRFIAVCQTLAYAHSKDIIHRDLKPANVMLGDYGETLVVDWGLAKRVGQKSEPEALTKETSPATLPGPADNASTPTVDYDPAKVDTDDVRLTAAGQVFGTPAFMPPEQARGEIEALGPAADIYSLGAILYTILTGKSPYRGETAQAVLKQVIAGPPPAPIKLSPGVPRALNAVCLKATARDAGARYRNATELASDVKHWLADEPVTAYREPLVARVGRWSRRHRTLVTSMGVAVGLLVVTGAVVAWWQDKLAGEQFAEYTRGTEQVEALLRSCETAIQKDDDAVAAKFALAAAEKRAENLGADYLKERLARCRSATDLLVELDRIDNLRWSVEEGQFQGNARAIREWPGAFARIGVVVGETPPAQAAEAVNGSLARDRLLAALDLWLARAATADRADLAAILAAADADPYRNAIRVALQRSDGRNAVAALAVQDEALAQPARFAAALGSITHVPFARRLAVLEAADRVHGRNFGLLMHAGGLYRNNDPETAAERIAWYRGASILRPANAVAHTYLGVALRDKKDIFGAIAEFRRAIQLDPKFTDAHINLGVALYDNGDMVGAMAASREAIKIDPEGIKIDPKYANAYKTLGAVLYSKGDLDGAIAALREAIKLDPMHAIAHNNLGLYLSAKGEVEGAIAEYRVAINVNPKYAIAHYNLGTRLYDKGDKDGAIVEYRAAIRLDPKFANAYHNLGYALRAKGDLDGAIAEYRAAIKLDPKNSSAHNNLGVALRDKKDLDGALAELREAIKLDPKNAFAHNNLRDALNAKGARGGEIAAHRQAVKLNPTNVSLRNALANALEATGDLDGAIVEYRTAIKLDPKFTRAHVNLGKTLMAKGDLNGAIFYYREAIKIDTKLAIAHNALANALRAKGDLDGAIAEFRAAIELDPKMGSAFNGLTADELQNWYTLLAKEGYRPVQLKGYAKNQKSRYDVTWQLSPGSQWWFHHGLNTATFDARKIALAKDGYRLIVESSWEIDGQRLHCGIWERTQVAQGGDIAEHRQAVKLNPNDPSLLIALGLALYAKGDKDGAIAEYRAAIKLDPTSIVPHMHLGNAMKDKGDLDGAIREYREAIKLAPNAAGPHLNLGLALQAKRDPDGALAEYREAVRLDPKWFFPHYRVGLILKAKGDLDGAITEYRAATKLYPKFAQAWNDLGILLAAQKKFPEAEAAYREAMRLQPNNPGAYNGLGLAFNEQKKFAKAQAVFQEVFRAMPTAAADPATWLRYNAARSAALAAAEKDAEAGEPAEKERVQFRAKALAWLRDDLAAWSKRLDSGKSEDRSLVEARMRHWQQDSDFASVRGDQSLAKLPEAERADWEKLWQEVEKLRQRAATRN